MADLQLSEPLKSALGKGAEIGLARAMADRSNPESWRDFVRIRLSELGQLDLSYIENLAREILRAGDYISGLNPEDDIDPNSIPTNPELFAGDWSGRRLFWFGEWNIPGTDEWYKFSGTLPDITSFPDIVVHAAELASSYIDAYPEKFHGPKDELPERVNVRILGQEKAF